MKKLAHIASAVALMAFASSAQAANIIWSTPTNDTGSANDVITSGTLFAANTTGPTTTLNGVTFTSGFAAPFTLTGVGTITNVYSSPTLSDSNYNTLVGTGAYSASSTPFTIDISGLTVGHSYAVQLFEPFWNSNWATAFTGGSSTSGLVNLSGPDQGAGASSVPQYVIGTFTAGAATQQIALSSPTSYVLLAAGQVRDEGAVPEPTTWIMMILGFGMVGIGLRARRQKVAVTYG
jgi:hypothetical protein